MLYMELSDSSFAVLGFCVFVCLFVVFSYWVGKQSWTTLSIINQWKEWTTVAYCTRSGLMSCSPSTSNQYYLMAVP